MPMKMTNHRLTINTIVTLKITIGFLIITSPVGYLTETAQACFVHCFPST